MRLINRSTIHIDACSMQRSYMSYFNSKLSNRMLEKNENKARINNDFIAHNACSLSLEPLVSTI